MTETRGTIIDDVEKLDTFRMDSFIISSSGFARTPDSNILIPIFYSVTDVFCNSNTLIAKLLTHSWKRELSNMQKTGTLLVRPGHTWSSTCHMLKLDLV